MNTDENEVGEIVEVVGAVDGRQRLDGQVAAVAGEPDPEGEAVGSGDPIHFLLCFCSAVETTRVKWCT